MDIFEGTQERVQNSGGKRIINVRAIKVLLLFHLPPNISAHLVSQVSSQVAYMNTRNKIKQ